MRSSTHGFCLWGDKTGDNALSPHGLSYDALTTLSEHGLVVHDFDAWRDYGPCFWPPFPEYNTFPFRHQAEHFMLHSTSAEAAPTPPLKFHGPQMTLAGVELSQVVDPTPAPAYLDKLKRFFQSRKLAIKRAGGGKDPS